MEGRKRTKRGNKSDHKKHKNKSAFDFYPARFFCSPFKTDFLPFPLSEEENKKGGNGNIGTAKICAKGKKTRHKKRRIAKGFPSSKDLFMIVQASSNNIAQRGSSQREETSGTAAEKKEKHQAGQLDPF